MLNPGHIIRLLYIQRILIRHGLDELVLAMHLFRPVRFIARLLPWNWFRRPHEGTRAERVRRVLEELGPIFIKFGQILSTRRDMLPEDVARELAKLQDHVPPFSGKVARQIIEDAFHKSVDDLFAEFDESPLASASIAQVHKAKMHDGREMIVKVVRPDIERTILRDLSLMHILADMAERYWEDVQRIKPSNIVDEFERTILDELDLQREAANASQLRRNFLDSESLYVPQVEWDLTRRNVMVMERIKGIPVADIEQLQAAGVDLKQLAEVGVEVFFTQVLRDNFFHADIHPGNIFVQVDQQGKSKILVVDFGIMSSLSEFDLRYLTENFLAFLNRDYQRVAELHVESGWVPAGTRVDEFEFAIRTVCEPLFDRPLREISYGTLLLRLFQTARRFNMVIMPQLILFQKTLVNMEGLGRMLYPELDIWHTARPILEHWMSQRVGVRGVIKGTKENVPHWLDRLPGLPNKTIDLIERLRDGRIQFEWTSHQMEELRKELRASSIRSTHSVIGSIILLTGIVLYGFNSSANELNEVSILSWVLGVLGVALLIRAIRE